ncbi:hypothetical protein KAT24_00380 [Candidatus Pacearchaeota archaeon]|nr:hypothetical protein [Candidatus Pacearchaeota archaeon]
MIELEKAKINKIFSDHWPDHQLLLYWRDGLRLFTIKKICFKKYGVLKDGK